MEPSLLIVTIVLAVVSLILLVVAYQKGLRDGRAKLLENLFQSGHIPTTSLTELESGPVKPPIGFLNTE